MTDFIQINGKKIPLTNEQVEQIKNAGIIKDNPFEREKESSYFYINNLGVLGTTIETQDRGDNERYLVANYCTDRKLMEQRALHETLNRLLWRFSMTHGGDEIDWNDCSQIKCFIYYNHSENLFDIVENECYQNLSDIYFKNKKTAEQAIKEIVKPFLKQHPEFVW